MIRLYNGVNHFWSSYVSSYESKVFKDLFVRFPWDEGSRRIANQIRKLSERRSTNRIGSYIDPTEIERVRLRLGNANEIRISKSRIPKRNESSNEEGIRTKHARDVSIRFGVRKTGHGYGKERGDFCLVSAVLIGKKITFFYRSIELIGGIAFDLVLIEELEKLLGIQFTQVDIWAKKAFVFALKGNSNQKLYPKLREIMRNA